MGNSYHTRLQIKNETDTTIEITDATIVNSSDWTSDHSYNVSHLRGIFIGPGNTINERIEVANNCRASDYNVMIKNGDGWTGSFKVNQNYAWDRSGSNMDFTYTGFYMTCSWTSGTHGAHGGLIVEIRNSSALLEAREKAAAEKAAREKAAAEKAAREKAAFFAMRQLKKSCLIAAEKAAREKAAAEKAAREKAAAEKAAREKAAAEKAAREKAAAEKAAREKAAAEKAAREKALEFSLAFSLKRS